MEIRYFNSNFDKITQNKDTDQSITNLREKRPSLNIVSDKNLLEETIKISNQFKEKKEKSFLLFWLFYIFTFNICIILGYFIF